VAIGACFFQKRCTGGSDAAFQEKVKNVVIDVAKQNPQLLVDAIGEGVSKKREDAIKQMSANVKARMEEIDKHSMKFGETKSTRTVVCFFDPLCKHCIEFQKNMVQMVEKKADVCFKIVPVAILGEMSTKLAKTYIALHEVAPAKTLAFLGAIVKTKGEIKETTIKAAVEEQALKMQEVEGKMLEAEKKLIENDTLAEGLGIPVVPAIFVSTGGEFDMAQSASQEQLLGMLGLPPKNPPTGEQQKATGPAATGAQQTDSSQPGAQAPTSSEPPKKR
jgi:protein-disulfide isomerase